MPVIAVTSEDGYCLMYSDEYLGTDGYTYISRRWTEKMPYSYEDDDFIYRFTLGTDVILYDKNNIMDSTGTVKLFDTNALAIRTQDEYANGLSGVASDISSITDSSSGYLGEANHSVTEKIGLLQKKAADFFHFSNQITSLAELAEQVDKEVEQLFTDSQKNFLQHHKSLRIDRWKIALLNLFVNSKNNLPFLGVLSNMIHAAHTTK